ncbi:MAG: TonB-dependent receptor [Acidobacteriota bacterium]
MRRILILAVLVGVTGSAAAQQARSSSAAAETTGHVVPQYADEVVVTATLEEEKRPEISATVTVISGEEIRRRQAPEVLDLLRTVAGVSVVRSGSPGKVTSLFTRGTNSNQTLFLWNGVAINDPFLGALDLSGLSTEGIERVEVVRGPFSALYGGDAVGGVVQLLPARHRGVALRLEGGEDSLRRGGVTAGLDTGAVHFDFIGQVRRGDGTVDNDFYDAEEITLRGDWAPRSDLSIGLSLRGLESEVGIPFDFFGNPSPTQSNLRESRQIHLPVRWTGATWSAEGHLAEYRNDLEARDPGNPFTASQTDAVSRTARTVVRRKFAGERGWVAGGGEWDEQTADRQDAFSVLPEVEQSTWAAFAQAHYRAGIATLDAGLRHDDADSFGSETSLRLGGVVALGEHARVRANYGEGFRPPTLSDLYFPGFGNPDLEAERAESWEVGLESERGPWGFGLVAFNIDQENLIQFAPPTFQPFNVGRARSRGLEGEASFARRSFRGRLNLTYLEAEDLDTGLPLLRRPEESASLLLSWGIADWTLHATGRYAGERADIGSVTLDAYTVADLAATWKVRTWIAPYVRVDNVFDEEYDEAAGFPAPDRTLAGGVTLNF